MLNVECSMLNVECGSAPPRLCASIQHSTLNIQHSTFGFTDPQTHAPLKSARVLIWLRSASALRLHSTFNIEHSTFNIWFHLRFSQPPLKPARSSPRRTCGFFRITD